MGNLLGLMGPLLGVLGSLLGVLGLLLGVLILVSVHHRGWFPRLQWVHGSQLRKC